MNLLLISIIFAQRKDEQAKNLWKLFWILKITLLKNNISSWTLNILMEILLLPLSEKNNDVHAIFETVYLQAKLQLECDGSNKCLLGHWCVKTLNRGQNVSKSHSSSLYASLFFCLCKYCICNEWFEFYSSFFYLKPTISSELFSQNYHTKTHIHSVVVR